MAKSYFTVADVQERYGVSQSTVLHWLHSGQLKYMNAGRDPGKKRVRYKILERHLRAFEESREPMAPIAPRRRRRRSADVGIEDFFPQHQG